MTSIISIDLVFYLIGAIVTMVAWMTLRDTSNPKRYTTAAFWFLFGCSFLFGDLMIALLGKQMTYRVVGVIVLIIAGIAGANLLGAGSVRDNRAEARRRSSEILGNRLFIPALAIPLITVFLTLFGKDLMFGGVHFLDPAGSPAAAFHDQLPHADIRDQELERRDVRTVCSDRRQRTVVSPRQCRHESDAGPAHERDRLWGARGICSGAVAAGGVVCAV